jgi:predicted ABC-class ATPase
MDRIFEDSFIEELEEEKNIKLIDLNDKERDKFIKELIQREEDVWDGLFKIIRGNFEDRGIVCWWD